jgi:hypothetical protein
MPRKMKEYIVKLEYILDARNRVDAVDFLVRTVRKTAYQTPERGIELLRTDVRRPGEAGDW